MFVNHFGRFVTLPQTHIDIIYKYIFKYGAKRAKPLSTEYSSIGYISKHFLLKTNKFCLETRLALLLLQTTLKRLQSLSPLQLPFANRLFLGSTRELHLNGNSKKFNLILNFIFLFHGGLWPLQSRCRCVEVVAKVDTIRFYSIRFVATLSYLLYCVLCILCFVFVELLNIFPISYAPNEFHLRSKDYFVYCSMTTIFLWWACFLSLPPLLSWKCWKIKSKRYTFFSLF